MHLHKAYERVPNFESLARESRVRFLEWKIVFALDGLKTGADIALAFGLSEMRTIEIFDRLIGKGIIAEVEIALEDYLERTRPPQSGRFMEASADILDGMRMAPGLDGLGEGRQSRVDSSPAPRISASISRRSHTPKPAVVEEGLNGHAVPPAPPSVVDDEPKKRFRLKSAIDFIQGHARRKWPLRKMARAR